MTPSGIVAGVIVPVSREAAGTLLPHAPRNVFAGSAVPADDIGRHTGAGRIARLQMRPMSLFETRHSTGEVSLRALLQGARPRAASTALTVHEIVELIAVGGWPGNLGLSSNRRMQAVRDYLDEIRRVDIARVDQTRRDPANVGRLLRSLARNVATYAAATSLAADAGGADGALDTGTVRAYLSTLERVMIVENQLASAPHVRSRSVLRRGDKRHFVDPSLAVAALRATPDRLLQDLELCGFLFESLVVRDLRVYAQAAAPRIAALIQEATSVASA